VKAEAIDPVEPQANDSFSAAKSHSTRIPKFKPAR
jgi:hypothetical protein